MKVQVHIDKLWGLVDISLRYHIALWGVWELCLGLIKDFMNLQKSLFIICLLFPTENFIVNDLFSTTSDIFAILNLLMENAVVKFHQNVFLKFADEGEIAFGKNASRNNHRDQFIMLNFDKLFDQIYLFCNDTVL